MLVRLLFPGTEVGHDLVDAVCTQAAAKAQNDRAVACVQFCAGCGAVGGQDLGANRVAHNGGFLGCAQLFYGTAIAFVLALLMVFLRIQEPDKRDNDFVKFLKIVANKFSRFYIFVIRGTPMMVQSLILYNAVFGLFKRTGMSVSDINRVWPLFLAGLVTISLNSTAYLAEVLRGGILAVDAGQMEAARSLGMTHWQAMRKVVFPQAIKNSLPAIGNEFIINIKDSSVLCVVGVSDLMFMTRSVAGIYYKGTECYLIAAIVYLFLTYLSSLLLKAITGKMTAPDNTKRHQGNQTVDLGLPSSN